MATLPAKPTQPWMKQRWLKPRVLMQRVHLWATLTLGIALLVVTTSGSIALFHREVDRMLEPGYHKVTPGAAISFEEAWGIIKNAYPNEQVQEVIRANDHAPYYARVGADSDKTVYVDPGTGQINGVKAGGQTIMGWFASLHTSLFLGEVTFSYPAWLPQWLQTWIGSSLSELFLKLTALALALMVITGAVLWWPGIRKMAYSFRVRTKGSSYIRNFDYHKVIGFIALPFLAMWAVTAMNFYEPFHPLIEKVWLTATFANVASAPEDLVSDATNKTARDQLSMSELQTIAQRELPEGSRIINLGIPDFSAGFADAEAEQTAREQTIQVWASHGLDPWKYGEFPGNYSVTIDQYSGKVLDTNEARLAVLGANIFENWFYPIHAGIAVPWWARTLWFVFGMIPLFLAVTGLRMYLIKRKGRAVKRKRDGLVAAGAD
jgi:uncharacterized iron-regulated membrane protein